MWFIVLGAESAGSIAFTKDLRLLDEFLSSPVLWGALGLVVFFRIASTLLKAV
jgi:hypothetical protein